MFNYRVRVWSDEDHEWQRLGAPCRTMRGAQGLAERKLRGRFAGFQKVGEAYGEPILEGTPLNDDGFSVGKRVRIEKGSWS